ncbi:MAG TPA: hypothetical protein PLY96_06505 [Chromatiaceae bacterium]|nr:hypothetical protein [Chromatiaceae bacterium]
MKSFAAYFLPPAALVLLVTLGVGLALDRAELDKLQVYESTFLTNGADAVFSTLSHPLQHLRGLLREPAINQALQAPPGQARTLMGQHLLTLAIRNPLYDQVRWLSATGLELARVNATPAGPVIVPEGDLQDKSARYYVQEAMRLAPGAIYLSPLDLNVEQAVVEVPYKPMIRMAIRLPVVDGRDQGLLVINYLAQSSSTTCGGSYRLTTNRTPCCSIPRATGCWPRTPRMPGASCSAATPPWANATPRNGHGSAPRPTVRS